MPRCIGRDFEKASVGRVVLEGFRMEVDEGEGTESSQAVPGEEGHPLIFYKTSKTCSYKNLLFVHFIGLHVQKINLVLLRVKLI